MHRNRGQCIVCTHGVGVHLCFWFAFQTFLETMYTWESSSRRYFSENMPSAGIEPATSRITVACVYTDTYNVWQVSRTC